MLSKKPGLSHFNVVDKGESCVDDKGRLPNPAHRIDQPSLHRETTTWRVGDELWQHRRPLKILTLT